MGFFIMVFVGIAALIGAVTSMICIAIAIPLLNSAFPTNRRPHIYRSLSLALIICLALIGFVFLIPDLPVSPGSDYDNATINLIKKAFGICMTPGIALLLTAVLSKFQSAKINAADIKNKV